MTSTRQQQVPRDACIAAPGMPRAQVVALEYLGGYRVDAKTPASATDCMYLLLMENHQTTAAAAPGWQLVARERRNTNDEDVPTVYRRAKASG